MKLSLIYVAALFSAVYAMPNPSPTVEATGTITDTAIPATFTATKKYFTLTDHAPWMIEQTTVITWTVTALPSSTGAA
ncbi:hypothetical protein PUNSTDRAFT_137446 [Punctularia strigosozonata HHB-11173 SS5]|uniref:uncharacterized protein n=1 Tax=Punctularia strigosozonata (strain HHB-11173) TaxID=741275 RepID=UPI0004417BEE|nr:uncharacterized protein PUNSTDRAFT_137446 [Punctularia strigosozonata HHB-11173 SS5]EIN05332.1 hypothetical protein PUNSTDRAFT_137446 [Punctularia strigosozonata HHB-11173 SS5]